jgi:RNase P subunit RPR2
MNLIVTAILVIGITICFIIATRNKTKLGINLKRVYCPVCGTKQPWLRIPQNEQQFLYGGTTCPKCGAKLDKYGNIIS